MKTAILLKTILPVRRKKNIATWVIDISKSMDYNLKIVRNKKGK